MKSSYLAVLLFPLAAGVGCASSQEISKESGAKPASTTYGPAAAPVAPGEPREPKKVGPVEKKVALPNPGKPTPDSSSHPHPITDPGGFPGYPFMQCTNTCAGQKYDSCSTVPVTLCPVTDKYCRAVVAGSNTCLSGETKTCPGNPAGIATCDVGPPDENGVSSCGWSKCKHCSGAGEPCCNPPAAACISGKTCTLVAGAAFPTCN